MAENNTRKDQIIDYDELDELPDVVLGEQTLAMRKLRENGKPVIDTKPKQQSKQNKALDEVNVYDQTTGIPSVEELLKQKIEQTEMAKTDSAQEKTVVLEKSVDDLIWLKKEAKENIELEGLRQANSNAYLSAIKELNTLLDLYPKKAQEEDNKEDKLDKIFDSLEGIFKQ